MYVLAHINLGRWTKTILFYKQVEIEIFHGSLLLSQPPYTTQQPPKPSITNSSPSFLPTELAGLNSPIVPFFKLGG